MGRSLTNPEKAKCGTDCLPLTRVRVSGGDLCKAEAPTEAVAETEGEKEFRYIKALPFLSLSRLSAPAPSSEGAEDIPPHCREPKPHCADIYPL